MRVEIILDKNQKLSQSILSAFQDEVSKRIQALFPETLVRVRQGSYTSIEMLGFSLDEDKRRLNDLLQNVWEDDSWLH
jgi:hypothetical protein